MSSSLVALFDFIGAVVLSVFNALDNAMFSEGFSYLDVLIALLFLRLVLWFVMRLLGHEFEHEVNHEVNQRAKRTINSSRAWLKVKFRKRYKES